MSKFAKAMDNYFEVSKSGSNFKTEIVAGLTIFFAMAYIIFVNPSILGQAGVPEQAAFLATIIASVIGTLIMGLFAKVPYAQAPGMGLNAFFTYTVVMGMGFSWEEALAMVFICGIINIIITVTNIRKQIIMAIPKSLQHAIGAGIGIFIAYIGVKNAGFLKFTADPGTYNDVFGTIIAKSSIVPAITDFSTWGPILAMIVLAITVVLIILKVRGAILIGIGGGTVISIIYTLITNNGSLGVTISASSWGEAFASLGDTIGVAFYKGMPALFTEAAKIPVALLAIFAFSLTDTFDTIGTFIGTGRKTGIFTDEDIAAIQESKGFKTKMEKALFADSVATSIGAIFGTSNTTTYVESAAGIGAGGKTGFTSVIVAIMFLVCILLAPVIGLVPSEATAPALIIVGIMMMSSLKEIEWDDLSEAIPAFFAAIMMSFAYSISTGIALGFIFYVFIKLLTGKIKEVHPILYICAALFFAYFIFMGVYAFVS